MANMWELVNRVLGYFLTPQEYNEKLVGARYVVTAKNWKEYKGIDDKIKRIHNNYVPLAKAIAETDELLNWLNPSHVNMEIATNIKQETALWSDVYLIMINPFNEILQCYQVEQRIYENFGIDALDDVLMVNRKPNTFAIDTKITIAGIASENLTIFR